MHDSTANMRYLVLPQRPAGSEGLGEAELAFCEQVRDFIRDNLDSATRATVAAGRHPHSGRGPVGNVKYRVPNQPDTGDGNTVDVQQERTSFMENGLEYQASLEFLNSRISGLLKAIKGDQA